MRILGINKSNNRSRPLSESITMSKRELSQPKVNKREQRETYEPVHARVPHNPQEQSDFDANEHQYRVSRNERERDVSRGYSWNSNRRLEGNYLIAKSIDSFNQKAREERIPQSQKQIIKKSDEIQETAPTTIRARGHTRNKSYCPIDASDEKSLDTHIPPSELGATNRDLTPSRDLNGLKDRDTSR